MRLETSTRKYPGAVLAALFSLVFLSCATERPIPVVADRPAEDLVQVEASRILAVSEDRDAVAQYKIFLSDFPREDILGLSIGHRRIYISHKLARLALRQSWHRWLLRQVLAHEIAHETAGHAQRNGRFFFTRSTSIGNIKQSDIGLPLNVTYRNYSYASEMEADLKGLRYWRNLHWDCRIWVRILESFVEHHYDGDRFHPTENRLQQARRVCPAARRAPLDGPAAQTNK